MIEKIIKNVLELPDVDGACIIDKKGVILHNALPSFFLDDFLEDLSRRVTSLYEAVDENYTPCEDYLLKFPQKYIQLRRSRHVYLLVVCEPSANFVSLRMVTNLVLKHITPKVLTELRATLAENASAAKAPEPAPAVAEVPSSEPVSVAEPEAENAAAAAPAEEAGWKPLFARGNKPKKQRTYRGAAY